MSAEVEKNGIGNAVEMLRKLSLEHQLPYTRELVAKAIHAMEIAHCNARITANREMEKTP